jgi:hypothetical protein
VEEVSERVAGLDTTLSCWERKNPGCTLVFAGSDGPTLLSPELGKRWAELHLFVDGGIRSAVLALDLLRTLDAHARLVPEASCIELPALWARVTFGDSAHGEEGARKARLFGGIVCLLQQLPANSRAKALPLMQLLAGWAEAAEGTHLGRERVVEMADRYVLQVLFLAHFSVKEKQQSRTKPEATVGTRTEFVRLAKDCQQHLFPENDTDDGTRARALCAELGRHAVEFFEVASGLASGNAEGVERVVTAFAKEALEPTHELCVTLLPQNFSFRAPQSSALSRAAKQAVLDRSVARLVSKQTGFERVLTKKYVLKNVCEGDVRAITTQFLAVMKTGSVAPRTFGGEASGASASEGEKKLSLCIEIESTSAREVQRAGELRKRLQQLVERPRSRV